MRCPTCPDSVLAMSEFRGHTLDYCPQCRGVWLRAGVLDRLIGAQAASAPPPVPQPSSCGGAHGQPGGHGYDKHGGYGKHGRKGWLHRLFD